MTDGLVVHEVTAVTDFLLKPRRRMSWERCSPVDDATYLIIVSLLQNGVLEEFVSFELEQELETGVLDIQVLEADVDEVTDGLDALDQ